MSKIAVGYTCQPHSDMQINRGMASLQLIRSDPAHMRTIYGYKIDGHEVSRGYLDIEWISTVVRNTTLSMLSQAAQDLETVALSVNAVQSILVGTGVLIECQLLQTRALKASVVIRNANLPHTIYATGTHIMAFKGIAARL
ncbi:hypothetical protein IWW36_002003 [Coemansia brasiliensis]|uniref:Uncharacterized protein n=1 Tax=Coemansia brasiliensis TaxID=2650707 RepID=A0A9W8M0B8_9FUNG|nr:hypothetical protein IWW36_002003 [Coemansia brasiliensis]